MDTPKIKLDAGFFFGQKAHFNKWLKELTDSEQDLVIDMMIEFQQEEIEQLQAQNARLLALLKQLLENCELGHWSKQVRAAIAEAETSSAHPSQPAQVIANLTRKLGDAIKALRDIAETLMEITGGSGPVQGSVSDAREIAKEALKPYQPDSPDPTDLARDYNDALRDADQPTPYDP